jgi:hypothetical protein
MSHFETPKLGYYSQPIDSEAPFKLNSPFKQRIRTYKFLKVWMLFSESLCMTAKKCHALTI